MNKLKNCEIKLEKSVKCCLWYLYSCRESLFILRLRACIIDNENGGREKHVEVQDEGTTSMVGERECTGKQGVTRARSHPHDHTDIVRVTRIHARPCHWLGCGYSRTSQLLRFIWIFRYFTLYYIQQLLSSFQTFVLLFVHL